MGLRSKYADFFRKPQNICLGLTADGFLAWGKKAGKTKKADGEKSGKSIWPLNITMYNLPPYLRTKLGATVPLGICPMKDFCDIQPFLEPLIDELLMLWDGVEMFNASTGQTERVRAMLVHIIGDYPAMAKLLSRKMQPTALACFLCKIKGFTAWQGKALYGGFWRWLAGNCRNERAAARSLNYKPPPRPEAAAPELPLPPRNSAPPALWTREEVRPGGTGQ